MSSPLERRQQNRKIGDAGRHAEKATIKRLGGRPTVASGAVGTRADYYLGEFVVENKSTKHGSFSISLAHLIQISREAAKKAKLAAMTINFTDSRGELVRHGNWVLVPEKVWHDLLKDKDGLE